MEHSKQQPVDLYLNDCGICSCKPEQTHILPASDDYVIHFVSDGKGSFYSKNRRFPLAANQVFLLFPNESGCRVLSDAGEPISYLWASFNGSKAESAVTHTSLALDEPVCSLAVPADQIKELMQEILSADSSDLPDELRRIGYLYRLLASLTASYQASHPKKTTREYPSKTYALYAMEYINNNYDHTNITDVANQIGIDRSYLHHIFKQFFQISPQEYLVSYRLKTAASLLAETNASVSQISQVVGYEDSLQFSKIFKKYYGYSPKHYRAHTCKERN